MSVLIKGMEMPKDCIVCPFGWNGCNKQHDFVYMGSRSDNCPLVPVPPHGGLIEKNAVFELIQSVPSVDKLLPVEFMKVLQEIPTVIPAEGGE